MNKLTICRYEEKMIIAVFFWILLYRPRRHHRRSVGEEGGAEIITLPRSPLSCQAVAQEEAVGGRSLSSAVHDWGCPIYASFDETRLNYGFVPLLRR